MAHDGPLTTDLGDGIVQIRLPMTGNPMRYINAYLLEDQSIAAGRPMMSSRRSPRGWPSTAAAWRIFAGC
jgi:hypothetical protein